MGLNRDRNDIKETQATIEFEPDFYYSGDSVDFYWDFYLIKNSNRSYIDGSTEESGSFTIEGLQSGTDYIIEGDCTINIGTKYEKKDPVTGESTGEYGWTYETESELDHRINIYTHPGEFDMGAVTGETIANVLDSEVINDKWIPHFQAAYHWYNQENADYDPANEIYPRSKDGMQVISGEPIFAEWFNNCMEGMRQFDKDVDDVRKDDLITAILINQMNFTGNE